jgi:hypothetical protein
MRLPKKVLGLILTFIVLGCALPALWPMLGTVTEDVTSMNVTGDAGGALIKTVWPVGLLLMGIGIAVALILFTLKKFGSLGRGR